MTINHDVAKAAVDDAAVEVVRALMHDRRIAFTTRLAFANVLADGLLKRTDGFANWCETRGRDFRLQRETRNAFAALASALRRCESAAEEDR